MKVSQQTKLPQEVLRTSHETPQGVSPAPPRELKSSLTMSSGSNSNLLKHSYEAFIVGYLDEEEPDSLKKLKDQAAARVVPSAEGKNEGSKSSAVEVVVPWKYEELENISNVDIVSFLLKAGSENFIVSNGLDGKIEDIAKKLSKLEATKLYKTLVETKQYYTEEEEGIFARFPKELCIYVRRPALLLRLSFSNRGKKNPKNNTNKLDIRFPRLEDAMLGSHGL